jgi:hypothetical protein
MFEGKNTITLSNESARSFFSKYLTDKFGLAIKVEAVETNYKGLELTFTELQPEQESEAINETQES